MKSIFQPIKYWWMKLEKKNLINIDIKGKMKLPLKWWLSVWSQPIKSDLKKTFRPKLSVVL